MELINRFIDNAKRNPQRIVYPEGTDMRVIEAAAAVRERGIAKPILLGDREEILALAAQSGISLDGIELCAPKISGYLGGFASAYAKARGLKETVATNVVRKPLAFGCMMLHCGNADGMVGGIASPTASVIQAATLTVGFQHGITTPSSFMMMIFPGQASAPERVLVFADCAVTIAPDSLQLAEIGIATGRNAATLLGIEPYIAFLSFSTKGSANHAYVDKVVEAVRIAREQAPELHIDGELQGDAAISERVGAKKAPGSPVAGKANVLIFPDLNAGNIGCKLAQYLGGGHAIGPILQGFAKPVNDMSRGATVDDIIGVTAITVLQAQAATPGITTAGAFR